MFKIFAMPLLAITIITWNTTAWGIISGDQADSGNGGCSLNNFLPDGSTEISNVEQNCSAHKYMCDNNGQCIKSCTACTVGELQDGSLIFDFSCKYKTCGSAGTSCTASCTIWYNTNVTGYRYRTCTKADCSTYKEYDCAVGWEGDAVCSSISSCYGCEEDEPETPSCSAGYYLLGNSCTTCTAGYYCPGDNNRHKCTSGKYSGTGQTSCASCPSDYPNSAAGSDAITDCYSNTKSRAWTGSQTACITPSGCASVSCDTCSKAACDYVAYSNSAGTGDGTIKSGCSSNSAACQKPVASVTASANHYVSDKTCPACPPAYKYSDGGSISDAYCYALKTNTGSQVSCSLGSANAQSYNCKECEPETCNWRDYKSAPDETPCTPDVCYQELISYTCKPGYYPEDNECELCTVGYYCDGSGAPAPCPEFTSYSEKQDGKSEAGSKSIYDCYAPKTTPLTATDDTGTYVCISDAPYQTGTH